jgi:hypothetical protein
MSLTPPPDAIFGSLEALLETVKIYAGNHSFTITTLHSKKNKAELLYKVWLKYD